MSNNIKILIVEDELIVAENIARNLRHQGYQVVGIANTGEDAIKEAIATRPNLVLMDIMLPGDIDGIEATRIIHTQLEIPVVYMTAYADNQTIERAKDTDPYGYLVKPFKPQDMRTTIEIVLKRYEKEKSIAARYTAKFQIAQENPQPINKLLHRGAMPEHFNQIISVIPPLKDIEGRPQNVPSLITPIFCLSLDRLAKLTNTLGYQGSDLLLNQVVERLIANLSKNSILAQLNAEEFAILIQPVKYKNEVTNIAEEILNLFQEPFLINNREIFISASIGIALYSRDGEQFEELLNHSKKALNNAHRLGGNRYEFYTELLSIGYSDELALEVDLRHAIERQELQLYYQPKVDLQTGIISGAEALLRWRHREKGFISPAKFIPLAEETGLIKLIGEWVLKTACEHTKNLHQSGLEFIRVAVNLSGYQFNQRDLPQQLLKITLNAGLDPKFIEFELTESLLITDVVLAINKLNALKALGIKIAIDDFGTGYSSLNYLQQLPFDILKIDQCFVRNVDQNNKKQAIIKAIIMMAHQLNFKVIAEGVETEGELAFLRQNNCDEIQGYLFSRPIPFREFKELLNSGKSLPLRR